MNIEEFKIKFKKNFYRDKIDINCGVEGCHRLSHVNKDSAFRNIKKYGIFKCRNCCYTVDGKKRISEATSYERSPDTCEKMSKAKKSFYQTERGQELKNKLSLATAENHTVHKFDKFKRKGVFQSKKTGKKLSYDSSYELLLCWMLDSDESVVDFETQLVFKINNRGRCLDCLITYKAGNKKAIEMKPKKRIDEFKEQINDSREYANQNGWDFQLMTEDDLGMSYKEIKIWADEYRSKTEGVDYSAYRREINKNKAKKYYQSRIANDKVEVYCEYCKEIHNPLRLTYDRNIVRNGRYVCEREGGHIAGSKPKPHLKKTNPYESEGKKECNACQSVLALDLFSAGKNICKSCRAKKYKEKYKDKKTCNLDTSVFLS